MPTCFVPGCTSGYKSNPQKRHYFAPPRDPQLLGRWTRAIPRADKVLTKTCKVCDVHFQEADIVKTYKHVINGETVEIDRGIWALKSDAVPCLFPNLPSYLSSQRKKRRSPKKRATAAKNEQPMSRDRPTDFQPEPPVPVKAFDFVNILESSGSLQLPKNWRSAALEEEPGERRQIVFL